MWQGEMEIATFTERILGFLGEFLDNQEVQSYLMED